MLDSATATDPAAKPHDAPPPAAPSSWWDSAMDSVGKAAGAVDHAAHSVGNAANSLAERGINAATGAVRHVAGDTAANAVHGAGESVRDTVKQGAGFAYGVGAGATGALGGIVKGTGDMVQGGVRLATDPAYRHHVEHQVARVAHHVAADPLGTARALGTGVVHAGDEWLRGAGRAAQEGNLGEYLGHATGSAAVNVGSFFIPGADVAGVANAAGHLGEAANVAGHLGEAANVAGHLGEASNVAGHVGKATNGFAHGAQLGAAAERDVAGAERGLSAAEHAGGDVERATGRLKRAGDDLANPEAAKQARTMEHPESQPAATEHAETPAAPPPLRERSFNNLDEFNAAANKAEPNTLYKFGDYTWKTDERGRTIEASGKVRVHEFGRNDVDLQRQIGKEGKPTDIGFHLIADSFDGPTNRLNVVPGNGKPIGDGLPNLNQGQYKKFENAVRNLANSSDKPVEIRIKPQYDSGNATTRPDRFIAEYREQGGAWSQRVLDNK